MIDGSPVAARRWRRATTASAAHRCASLPAAARRRQEDALAAPPGGGRAPRAGATPTTCLPQQAMKDVSADSNKQQLMISRAGAAAGATANDKCRPGA